MDLIRVETPRDYDAVRRVHRRAFGQEAEGELVDELRRGGYLRESLVAERDGEVVGHILFSDLRIETGEQVVAALALAPMAVLPDFQNQGIGSELVRRGLDRCRTGGHRIVIVVGHPAYYPRFGFSPQWGARLQSRYSGEAFMALELVPGALDGVTGRVVYTAPFERF